MLTQSQDHLGSRPTPESVPGQEAGDSDPSDVGAAGGSHFDIELEGIVGVVELGSEKIPIGHMELDQRAIGLTTQPDLKSLLRRIAGAQISNGGVNQIPAST